MNHLLFRPILPLYHWRRFTQLLMTGLVLLSLGGFSVVSSCTTISSGPTPEILPLKQRELFLWEAKRNGKTLYLFGTIHIGASEIDMSPELWKHLREVDGLITEVNMDLLNPELVQKFLYLPEGQNLETRVGQNLWQKIIKEFSSIIPPENLQRFTLAGFYTMVSVAEAHIAFKEQSPEYNTVSEEGLDQIIKRKAKNLSKTLLVFETPEEQMKYLDQAIRLEDVRAMVSDRPATRDSLKKLRAFYLNGDNRAITMLVDEMPKEMRKTLLDARNERWVAKLPTLIQSQNSVFIAVGAGHMGGDKGLLKLLEKQGYRVQRIKVAETLPAL